MVNCPVCQNPIDEDFGLVTCSSCGTPVLIELDGGAQIGNSGTQESAADLPAMPPFEQIHSTPVQPEEPPSIEAPEPFAAAPAVEDPPPATSDMGEIAAFGNDEISQGKDGNLRFNLMITGIDTADIRKNLLDTIFDEKFQLNREQILTQLKRGELRLEGLSPVKCALLVQKIRWLPIHVRWEQYGIHDASL